MNSRERIKLIYQHREADRVPIIDYPWGGTLRRWHEEGLPKDVDWRDYFDVDKVATFQPDNTARLEKKIIEETDRYVIETNNWGATLKRFKELDSTPEYLDYSVKTAKDWFQIKKKINTDDDRIPWDLLKNNYDKWKAEGQWIRAGFWFGFDVTHSYMMGLTDTLINMMEDPDLMCDIFDTYLTASEKMNERIWNAGYKFDEIMWYDDMGYKGTSFFSPTVYREVLKPFHTRAVNWAHERGIYAQLHSCGNIMNLIPDVVETGVDILHPLEIKAGMDAIKIKKEYGDKLVLRGGINALLCSDEDKVIPYIEEIVPILKENGGYVFATDHSIPNNVSLQTMKKIIEKAKECGKY